MPVSVLPEDIVAAALAPGAIATHGSPEDHDVRHAQIHKRLASRGFVIDPYADAGMDPDSTEDVTAGFGDIDTWLKGKGGGTILLPPMSAYHANLDLNALNNVVGHGVYSSRIFGIQGAGKPVLKKNCFQGDFVRGVGLYGTLPWDGTTGSNADPEAGLYLYHGGWWSSTRVTDVGVFLTRGIGYANYTQGTWTTRMETQYTGGRGVDTIGGSTDTVWADCIFGPVLGGDYIVNAIGLAAHWRNCKAYQAGQVWDGTNWGADNLNTTAIAWALGTDQDLWGCISEDNPVGVVFFGDGCRFRGLSAGDRIPARFQVLDPSYRNNVLDLDIRCNDRFVPVKGVEVAFNYGGKAYVAVDWESQSVSGPHSQVGKIKDQAFVIFDDQSPGFNALYNANEYDVRGSEGWTFTNAATVSPDIINGTRYYVQTSGAATTINAFVHRNGLQGGRKLVFVLDPGAATGRTVTFNGAYNAGGAITLTAGVTTTVEFTNVSPSFAAPVWRKTGQW